MKNISLIIIAFSFLFLFGFAGKTPAQIAGGYNATDAKSADVNLAARFAVTKESKKFGKKLKFVSVSQAARQVVAGTNYKVCLKVRDGRKTRTATAVVYQNLKQKYSLTSWDWDNCSL